MSYIIVWYYIYKRNCKYEGHRLPIIAMSRCNSGEVERAMRSNGPRRSTLISVSILDRLNHLKCGERAYRTKQDVPAIWCGGSADEASAALWNGRPSCGASVLCLCGQVGFHWG